MLCIVITRIHYTTDGVDTSDRALFIRDGEHAEDLAACSLNTSFLVIV